MPYYYKMTPQQESKLKKMGPFTLHQSKKMGLNHQRLSKLVKEGKILRLSRGIYIHPQAKMIREIDFQVACLKFGHDSVIGGLSALFYYNLVEQVPLHTWVIVAPEKRSSERGYRLIRTKIRPDQGIIEGSGYRIVSIERAIVEGFKLASKIGERIVINAARSAIRQKLTTINKIGKMAKTMGSESNFYKYFEAIVP